MNFELVVCNACPKREGQIVVIQAVLAAVLQYSHRKIPGEALFADKEIEQLTISICVARTVWPASANQLKVFDGRNVMGACRAQIRLASGVKRDGTAR